MISEESTKVQKSSIQVTASHVLWDRRTEEPNIQAVGSTKGSSSLAVHIPHGFDLGL